MDIDPITQRPKEELKREEAEKQDGRLARLRAEGEAMDSAIASTKGKKLISEIHDQLEARINTLIETDGHAQALIGLLRTMGDKMAIGRGYAQKLIERNLRIVR